MLVSNDRGTVKSDRVSRLDAYWASRRGDADWPLRSDIKPDEITDLLPNVVISEVTRATGRVYYRLVGTLVAEMSRIDFTGRWLQEMRPAASEPGIWERAYDLVRETGKPVFGRTGIPIASSNEIMVEEEFGIFPLRIPDPERFQCIALEDYGDMKHIDPGSLKAMSPLHGR